MPTLNVKLMVVCLCVVIVIAGSAHFLHSYQLQRHSTLFKTQAEAAWRDIPQRDAADAITLMNAYLRLQPNDFEAREELGFWLIVSGRFSRASAILEELARALEKQTSPDLPVIQRVRRKLIDAYLPQGRCADAAYHLEVLKKELPGDADVLNMLGKCLVTLGQEEGKGGKTAPSRTSPKRSNCDPIVTTSTTTRPWPCVFLPCRNCRKPRSAWRR